MIITSLIWLEVSGAFLSMVQMRQRCHTASLSLICDRLLLLLQGKVSLDVTPLNLVNMMSLSSQGEINLYVPLKALGV